MRESVVDRSGVRGPAAGFDWEIDPARVRWPFPAAFENFRLLDPLSRFVAIAVEALGPPFPGDAALVLATTLGCLDTDRRFEESRHGDLRPGLFPYTLPSAPLAAVAIRHGLRGPTLCLAGPAPAALEEAQRLLDVGDAPAAIVVTGDVVPPDVCRVAARYLEA